MLPLIIFSRKVFSFGCQNRNPGAHQMEGGLFGEGCLPFQEGCVGGHSPAHISPRDFHRPPKFTPMDSLQFFPRPFSLPSSMSIEIRAKDYPIPGQCGGETFPRKYNSTFSPSKFHDVLASAFQTVTFHMPPPSLLPGHQLLGGIGRSPKLSPGP